MQEWEWIFYGFSSGVERCFGSDYFSGEFFQTPTWSPIIFNILLDCWSFEVDLYRIRHSNFLGMGKAGFQCSSCPFVWSSFEIFFIYTEKKKKMPKLYWFWAIMIFITPSSIITTLWIKSAFGLVTIWIRIEGKNNCHCVWNMIMVKWRVVNTNWFAQWEIWYWRWKNSYFFWSFLLRWQV